MIIYDCSVLSRPLRRPGLGSVVFALCWDAVKLDWTWNYFSHTIDICAIDVHIMYDI